MNEQEEFWRSKFGDNYVDRNMDARSLGSRTGLFSKILSKTSEISTILEIGANIGFNLLAIKNLLPASKFAAIEINKKAVETLSKLENVNIFEGSVFDFESADLGKYDLTFTAGVLIHIHPDRLSEVYSTLYECSKKYILVSEYYNPTPLEVTYRGHSNKLFKRDFAGEILDRYSDLKLIDYGFQYHRDYNFPADDTTWFLLQK